jgi:hypothetical protein
VSPEIWHDTGDQNILIACLTPAQAKAITKGGWPQCATEVRLL